MLADIFQDTFAGEAGEGEGGEEETTGGYFYCYFYWYFYCSGYKVFCFLALEFHSQNTHARIGITDRRLRAWVLEIDVRHPRMGIRVASISNSASEEKLTNTREIF